jgi:superfamily II DNA helicase RecQ
LNLLERHGVIEGDLERGRVDVLLPRLPEVLEDPEQAEEKKRRDLTRLHDLVRYVSTEECRHQFLHEFFGMPAGPACATCDVCRVGVDLDYGATLD